MRINRIGPSLPPLSPTDMRERPAPGSEGAGSHAQSNEQPTEEDQRRQRKQGEAVGSQRRAEGIIEGTTRKTSLAPKPAPPTQTAMLEAARRAGLLPSELAQLRERLRELQPVEARAQIRFLQVRCEASVLRCYLKLAWMQRQYPDRFPSDLVQSALDCVHQDKLKQDQVVGAADALAHMPAADHSRLLTVFRQAAAASAKTQVISAVAQNRKRFLNLTLIDRIRLMAGLPTEAMLAIQPPEPEKPWGPEMLDVKPAQYVKEGLLADAYYAHAMAMRLQEEGTSRQEARSILDRLLCLAQEELDEMERTSDIGEVIDEIAETTTSLTLSELFQAAGTYLHDWPGYALLIVHLSALCDSAADSSGDS